MARKAARSRQILLYMAPMAPHSIPNRSIHKVRTSGGIILRSAFTKFLRKVAETPSAVRSIARAAFFPAITAETHADFITCRAAICKRDLRNMGRSRIPMRLDIFRRCPIRRCRAFTHNFIIYDSGALPGAIRGKTFWSRTACRAGSWKAKSLRTVPHSERRDISWPVTSDDRWFRPVDIKLGPDGAIYVCDWYDQQVNHFRNHEGKIDQSNGRIYRLKAKDAKTVHNRDLTQLSSRELVNLLLNKNRWIRQTALRLLADRHDPSILALLERNGVKAQGQFGLESLWALNLSLGLNEAVALKMLDQSEPLVREWTTRLTCDEKEVSTIISDKLAHIARAETNLEVRNQLAASARRLPAAQCLPIIRHFSSTTRMRTTTECRCSCGGLSSRNANPIVMRSFTSSKTVRSGNAPSSSNICSVV